MATVALVSNLVTYLTQVMHFDISDAANQVTNFLGTGYILSIPIAALADMYIGRPKTVLLSACFEIVVCRYPIYLFKYLAHLQF